MSFSTWPGYGPSSTWALEQPPAGSDSAASSIRLHRALGMLEAKFDRATQQGGCSDTFLRLKVTTEHDEALLARLPLAWAALRAAHPALVHSVADAADSRSYKGIAGVPTREFLYQPPTNEAEAYSRAVETILLEPAGDDPDGTMARLLDEHILNGPRTLLDQSSCLARLLLVRDERPNPSHYHYITLLISHVISDGLSIVMLMRELFGRLSSPSLPTPAASPTYTSVSAFLSPHLPSSNIPTPPSSITRQWRIVLPLEDTLARLPLASEHHYPSIPIQVARRRWIWAISRTIVRARHTAYPRTLQLRRLSPSSPPSPTLNSWPTLKFERETSARLLRFCKSNAVSPSMLLYSILSIVMANILSQQHPEAPYSPVVIGFPHSARPFLDSTSPGIANDLAIRLKFGYIQLPFVPQPEVKGKRLSWSVLQGARLAKRQFTRRFSAENRSLFLAEAYFAMFHRILSSAGAKPPPFNEPKTAINASMIGDIDRLLPTSYSLPSLTSSTPTSLLLSDILIGTRLHPGEGMLIEAYTFEDLITMSVGFDSSVFAKEQVDEILQRVARIGEALVEVK